jgi:predicted N-acyltransferase
VARGFLPTRTWSAHWIGDEPFRRPIGNFLDHEIEGMEDYIAEMQQHSPYKTEPI